MRESMLGHEIEEISEIDTDSGSHWDDDGGFSRFINREH
jgi:hypothetical protein